MRLSAPTPQFGALLIDVPFDKEKSDEPLLPHDTQLRLMADGHRENVKFLNGHPCMGELLPAGQVRVNGRILSQDNKAVAFLSKALKLNLEIPQQIIRATLREVVGQDLNYPNGRFDLFDFEHTYAINVFRRYQERLLQVLARGQVWQAPDFKSKANGLTLWMEE